MPRKASWRAVKRHRNYTVDDVSRTLNVTKGTVRRWIKTGLPALKDQRPSLILGGDLIGFLQAKAPAKHKCRLEECYCFSCRAPKRPAFNEVEFHPSNAKSGNLRALCETCSTVMHKRMSQADLASLSKSVMVTLVQNCHSSKQAAPPLSIGTNPSLNDHLKQGSKIHAKAPSQE